MMRVTAEKLWVHPVTLLVFPYVVADNFKLVAADAEDLDIRASGVDGSNFLVKAAHAKQGVGRFVILMVLDILEENGEVCVYNVRVDCVKKKNLTRSCLNMTSISIFFVTITLHTITTTL